MSSEKHILTLEETRMRFKQERQKDPDIEKQLNRQFSCEETFVQRFNEHIKQGDFKKSVMSKLKVDQITERIEKNVMGAKFVPNRRKNIRNKSMPMQNDGLTHISSIESVSNSSVDSVSLSSSQSYHSDNKPDEKSQGKGKAARSKDSNNLLGQSKLNNNPNNK